jgi:Flp pilus assembly protein CpaB
MAVRARPMDWSLPRIERRYLVAGLVAAVAAALVLVVTQPPPLSPVLVAGSDLPAGVPLRSSDVDVRYVDSTDGLVAGDALGDLEDWSLSVAVKQGEPLLPSLLRAPEIVAMPNVLAMSLDPEHAVLGQLGTGDHVDIYHTAEDHMDAAPSAELIARGVYVVDVELSDDPGMRGAVRLLLAVDDRLAPILASAARNGTVDLVKVGAP